MNLHTFCIVAFILSLLQRTTCIARTKEMEDIFRMLEAEIRLKRLSHATPATAISVTSTSTPPSLTKMGVEMSISSESRHAPSDRVILHKVTSNLCHMNRKERTLSRRKRDIDGEVLVVPSKWPKTVLSYRVHNHPDSMNMLRTRHAIYRAFRIWSKCSSLIFFEKKNGTADINLRFESGDHGDGDTNAFDGPGGHLAHAHAPPRGEVHFDADEKWGKRSSKRRHVVVKSEDGKRSIEVHSYYSLVLAAVHEIGHALGLKHTAEEEAIMYPLYSERRMKGRIRLHVSDVEALQSLYGPPSSDSVTNNTRKSYGSQMPAPLLAGKEFNRKLLIETLPNPCNSSFDAAFSVGGIIYFFNGRYYWTLEDETGLFSEPERIKKRFDLSKPRVDAACYSEFSERTYIFSGQKYWRYYNNTLEFRYPRLSRNHGIPSKPDAAIQIPGTPSIIIFKKRKFYIFDELDETTSPPQIMRPGTFLPRKFHPLDSALAHGENAYFFSRGKISSISREQLEDVFLKRLKVTPTSKFQAPWRSACV